MLDLYTLYMYIICITKRKGEKSMRNEKQIKRELAEITEENENIQKYLENEKFISYKIFEDGLEDIAHFLVFRKNSIDAYTKKAFVRHCNDENIMNLVMKK